jgi:hypothetical protein
MAMAMIQFALFLSLAHSILRYRILLEFCWSSDSQKGLTGMAGKQKQTVRKPATKFAHLRKKMEKSRLVSRIGNKKK